MPAESGLAEPAAQRQRAAPLALVDRPARVERSARAAPSRPAAHRQWAAPLALAERPAQVERSARAAPSRRAAQRQRAARRTRVAGQERVVRRARAAQAQREAPAAQLPATATALQLALLVVTMRAAASAMTPTIVDNAEMRVRAHCPCARTVNARRSIVRRRWVPQAPYVAERLGARSGSFVAKSKVPLSWQLLCA